MLNKCIFLYISSLLETDDFFNIIAFTYRHSTVCTIVKGVCDAIGDKTLHMFMPTPTENEWRRIANEV